MPRTIEIEMTHDLVGSCRAGDVVTVLGLVKVMNAEAEGEYPDIFCRLRWQGHLQHTSRLSCIRTCTGTDSTNFACVNR